MRKIREKNRGCKLLCLICSLVLIAGLLRPLEEVRASGAIGTKVIRVGYYPMEGFHKLNDGQVQGYEAEYLERLSWIAGWEIQYVELSSWMEGMTLLNQGEIDLMSPAERTMEREQQYLFSAEPVCSGMGIAIVPQESDITYADYDAMAQLKYGAERGAVYGRQFKEYAEDHGFQPNIVYYDNYEAICQARERGEIDAMLVNSMRLDEAYRCIGQFGMTYYYFMLGQDQTALVTELNEAVRQLLKTESHLQEKLLNKYYPYFDLEPFTKEELEFLETLGTLRVGCITTLDPVSFINEHGEPEGIAIDLLERISQYLGVEFEYVPLPKGHISYEDMVALDIDLIGGMEFNSVNALETRVIMTIPYLQAEKCLAGRKGEKFEPDMEALVGITSGSATIEQAIRTNYPNVEIAYYNSLDSALTAAQQGEIDFVVQNQYSLERCLEKPKYDDLAMIAKAGVGDLQCIGILTESQNRPDAVTDPRLRTVLNKAVQSIPANDTDLIIIENTVARHNRYSIMDAIYVNRHLLSALAVALVVALVLLGYSVRVHRKNIQLLKANQRKLIEERQELERKSSLDLLTGLLNKSSFEESCRQYLSANPQEYSAFAFVDLDHFKQINDALGHMKGDQVLKQVAEVIQRVCRGNSYLSRFGGDEFCILMTNVDAQAARDQVQQLVESVCQSGETSELLRQEDPGEHAVQYSISCGCVCFQNNSKDYAEIIGLADQALYQAKESGRNCYVMKQID